MTDRITISNGVLSIVMPRVRAVEVGATEVAKRTEMASGRVVKDVLGYRTTILAQWDYVPVDTIAALLVLLRGTNFLRVTYPSPNGGATEQFEIDFPTLGIFAFVDGVAVWHGVTLSMRAQEVVG